MFTVVFEQMIKDYMQIMSYIGSCKMNGTDYFEAIRVALEKYGMW